MMGTKAFTSRINLEFKWFILLLMSDVAFSYTFPYFGVNPYFRGYPIRRPAYLPIPIARQQSQYQIPEYDDGFAVPTHQEEYKYNAYVKYPYVQYYMYYPTRDYYHDKIGRRNPDPYGYYEDEIPGEDDIFEPGETDDEYETWYEEDLPRYDPDAKAREVFIENLRTAQLYPDTRKEHTYAYDPPTDVYDDDQHWYYGEPTPEDDEQEKFKQYFRDGEDEEVRELESLSRKKENSNKLKDENKKYTMTEVIDKPTKPRSRMTDEEYFDLQKQLVVNSRKNNKVPAAEQLRFSKKQANNPVDVKNNFWDFHNPKPHFSSFPESATNSIKKLNLIKEGEKIQDVRVSDSKSKLESTATVTSTVSPRRPTIGGQKEVVLPRPSNPVRRPLTGISARSYHQPSAYNTIKRLLSMEKDLQKNGISKPQKRFVLNEDQLTSELSGLKKLSA